MGTYLNPGNDGFSQILKGDYIDKTGLMYQINSVIDTPRKLVCISRPRRFGKSFAAQMLCAYYDKTCDSGFLFDDLAIAKTDTYRKFLNKFDILYLNMTDILSETSAKDFIGFIRRNITRELQNEYPSLQVVESFGATLVNAAASAGNKFVMIIDEWDAPIRENPENQREYLEFLRSLFKSSATTAKVFAAVYMTGILPIKKDGSQSAISDFEEYTMIKPRQFGPYVGFTEEEVKNLCKEKGVDFDTMKQWYDGYSFKGVGSVYNPNSVMKAIQYDDFDSYWTQTSAAESLMKYISQDYNGLTKTIAELIGGVDVKVDTLGFANDLTTFRGRDDVLTLLIHLGYLAYNSETKTVRIPNEEIRIEFQRSIKEVKHHATLERLHASEQLFLDTIQLNEEAVGGQIEKIHSEETAPLHYNKEDSLRSVIKLAYYTYRDHYLMFEELPCGEGYADIVYLPKHDSDWPALVIELKWNQSADGAISQIMNRKYPEFLKDYDREILLVGISYQKDAVPGQRKHSCKIIRYKK